MAYTLAKVAEPWRSLFPTIKESSTSVEITVRGQSFNIDIPEKQAIVTSMKNLSFKS
ncbi:MAG: hypothetical protein V7L23_29965 [Nostoc sp.]|uniref:hypothetical protein n=1 Tax=Nostoc sp. TaxID=1180 RepID=UPI002FF267C2